VPHSFVSRMQSGNIDDPLLRQVLPVEAELQPAEGFLTDPLGEQREMESPGILKKYRGRALLTMTGACGIHCRYCFRRHFPYTESNPIMEYWETTLDWLRQNTDVSELILSGGDPLSLADKKLAALVDRLDRIAHLKTLRIHTRLPIILPARIDAGLLSWISSTRLNVVMVVHSNHPNEIDASVNAAMRELRQARVTLLNQSVLLRGINDSAAILARLCETLFSAGVLPYYLHQLDRVLGAAHFEVPDSQAIAIHRELRAALPGYLVPRLVREIPGQPGKTPIT
jgi:EF-P beta-lysylation protein EpmB